MNIEELVNFLIAEVGARKPEWQVKKISKMVFIDGPKSSPSNHHTLAIISFFRTPPMLEILEEGVNDEDTIDEIWKKYQFLKDACLLLQNDASKRKLNWHVIVSDNNIHILGPNRSQEDPDKIAKIFFEDDRWHLEIFSQDLATKEIVLGMFSERIEIPHEISSYSESKDDAQAGHIAALAFFVLISILVVLALLTPVFLLTLD